MFSSGQRPVKRKYGASRSEFTFHRSPSADRVDSSTAWKDMMDAASSCDDDETAYLTGADTEADSTPPTTPASSSHVVDVHSDPCLDPVIEIKRPTRTTKVSVIIDHSHKRKRNEDKNTLFSYFGSNDDDESPNLPLKSRHESRQRRRKTVDQSQTILDISNRSSTKTCKECSMSYVIGVEEDSLLHTRHHERIVNGIEWLSLDLTNLEDCGVNVLWKSGFDSVVVVDVSILKTSIQRFNVPTTSKSKLKKIQRQVQQARDMTDTSLGATSLSPQSETSAKVYLYIGSTTTSHQSTSKKLKSDRKSVIQAVCVASRITSSFRVLPSSSDDPRLEMTFSNTESTSLSCTSTTHTSLLGIHRIYTRPKSRHQGFASQLLTHAAESFIYGISLLAPLHRQRSVAFSQPTESGSKLAQRWTGTPYFSVFVD